MTENRTIGGKIVLTGAAGGVGRMIRPLLREIMPGLVLSDRVTPNDLRDGEVFETVDLNDQPALSSLLKDAKALIHLGGYSVEGSWDDIHESNIQGLFKTYETAREEGVERVIFASSNHAVGFYQRRRRIGVDEPVRPDTRYGVSKAFGEALGSFYADKYGLRVMNIRIGNVGHEVLDKRRLSIWLHPEDLVQLIEIGLTHADLHNAIVYGMSNCERAWWDNKTAHDLGYEPKHSAEDHIDGAMLGQERIGPDEIGDRFQGGGFCSPEFSGDLNRTHKN